MKRILLTGVIAVLGFAAMTLGVGGAGGADVAKLDPGQFGQTLFAQLPELPYDPLVDPPGFFQVKPQEFDPAKTGLVQAAWLDGTGCPTHATIALPNSDFTAPDGSAPYDDTGCPTGDSKDQHFEGLLLAKTGPSGNFASAGAELNRVKGIGPAHTKKLFNHFGEAGAIFRAKPEALEELDLLAVVLRGLVGHRRRIYSTTRGERYLPGERAPW